jgi:hypothetical protein
MVTQLQQLMLQLEVMKIKPLVYFLLVARHNKLLPTIMNIIDEMHVEVIKERSLDPYPTPN